MSYGRMHKVCYHLEGFVEEDGLGEALGSDEAVTLCHLLLPMLLEWQQARQWQPLPAHVT